MSHWRSIIFWSDALVVWFIVMLAFSLCGAVFLNGTQAKQPLVVEIIGLVAYLLTPVGAGYAYARRQFEKRKPKQDAGFPVIAKDNDGDHSRS